MNSKAGMLGVAALAVLATGSAQSPAREPTLEERVLAIERNVASLSTRFELRETARAPGGDAALAARVDELERTVNRLATDLRRIESTADNALREASQARRDAQDAQREARDAAMRVR